MSIKNLIKLKETKAQKEALYNSYLNHSLKYFKYRSHQYKNIILDMDKTLIEGYFSLKYQKMFVEERPYLAQFFTFIFQHFEHVSIWTNANREWYNYVYDNILYKYIPRGKDFDFVFTFDDGLVGKDNNGPKDLSIVFDVYENLGYNKDNTILIDDSEVHYNKNPKNCYLIKGFEVDLENNSHKYDTELLKIISLFRK